MRNVRVFLGDEQKLKRILSRAGIISLLTLIYYFAGKFGLSLAFVNPSATAVWPPTGIAIAAFLVLGDYVWFGILLGAFLVNFTTSGSIPASMAVAMGNTLEGLIGAHLVIRFAHGVKAFDHTQDVFKFAILAGLFSPVVSASIGVTSLVWSGLASAADLLAIWLTWWLGDASGSLIVAPLLILWATKPKVQWNTGRAWEAAFLLALLLFVALAVFGKQSAFAGRNYPLEFIVIPLVVWAAYRFGRRGAATTTIILSAIATLGTLHGYGPFARELPNESLLLLQSFMITMAITGLSLAAMVSERHEVEAALKESNEKLQFSLDQVGEHNHKMILLNEMGDLLQSCQTFEEAYTIIGQLGARLLPEETGVLYLINNSQNSVEAATSWGRLAPEADSFTLNDCWALRRGKIHLLNHNENVLQLACPHLKDLKPVSSLCIPMSAQGVAMGILHIRCDPDESLPLNQEKEYLHESKQQIARAMADSMALALANLKLRIVLREQSIRDPLTGLFNRRYLEETLEREFNRAVRLQRPVGVLMLDLDHFKNFNDTFGHEAGDVLLRKLGTFLKEHLRGGDIACRLGGEEFAVIIPEVELKKVQMRADQLREGIKRIKVEHHGTVLASPTMSVGIAMFPEHGQTSQTVMNAADAALYQAKNRGRDLVVVASFDSVEDPPAS